MPDKKTPDPFQPGEIVDITIKGVRVVNEYPSGALKIAAENGDVFDMPPQAAITRANPVGWPPRKNDVWRDRFGELLIGAVYAAEGPLLRSVDGSNYDEVYALGNLIPLSLIHREEQDGGAA